jgi:dCMP deaminase
MIHITRIGIHEYFLEMAELASQRSTCLRRAVGCVLTSESNKVLATGYNGVPKGMEHCITTACSGAYSPSGTGLDECMAVHAEINALIQCSNVEAAVNCYCTTSPCVSCVKALVNSNIQTIYFIDEYPQSQAKELWLNSNPQRRWLQFKEKVQWVEHREHITIVSKTC